MLSCACPGVNRRKCRQQESKVEGGGGPIKMNLYTYSGCYRRANIYRNGQRSAAVWKQSSDEHAFCISLSSQSSYCSLASISGLRLQ